MSGDQLDLDAIEKRAEAVACSPWRVVGNDDEWGVEILDDRGFRVAIDVGARDAAHIAGMDPATTIALVAEVRWLREALSYKGRCTACHGDGTVNDGSTGPMGCQRCNGSGIEP